MCSTPPNLGQTLLTPNTELAAALIDWVERRHLALGHEIWPTPRIRDFSGWLRERYAERQLLDASLPRCLSDVEERELWRSVILDSEGGAQLLEPNGAAQSARRARRTLMDYGIPLKQLADYATEESLAFLDWNARFEARCRALRCIAPDQLLNSAPTPPGLVWIESPIWRPVARRWLESNAVAMLLPPRASTPALRRVVAAGSPAAELAAIAEWAAERLRQAPDFRAWICIPDLHLRRSEVADAFDAVLAPQRFSLTSAEVPAPYAMAGGTPLADYPPVRTALAALAATSGLISFEAFSDLLAHAATAFRGERCRCSGAGGRGTPQPRTERREPCGLVVISGKAGSPPVCRPEARATASRPVQRSAGHQPVRP